MDFTRKRGMFLWIVFHRILPPIAVLVPLVFTYTQVGLRDTRAGVILAHAAVNLPFAILLLKSFFDDVPREVGEAATIDGATRLQSFIRIYAPLVKGGIAATAVLCLILFGLVLWKNRLMDGVKMAGPWKLLAPIVK